MHISKPVNVGDDGPVDDGDVVAVKWLSIVIHLSRSLVGVWIGWGIVRGWIEFVDG